MNTVRREASRKIRNKEKEQLKEKINELAAYSTDFHRAINSFLEGYQPRTRL
jgi:hypothetical protein